MDTRKIALELADVLEKELYTQVAWEERLSTVWLRLKDDPTLELCERLVEHAIKTNAPKIIIDDLPRTVAGFREISHRVKLWTIDLQARYDSRELESVISGIQNIISQLVDGALANEAYQAQEHFYNQRITRVLNQFCLDNKVYGPYPDLRQLVTSGYYPGHIPFNGGRWRYAGGFGSPNNDVDSRVYINSRLHQTIAALRDQDHPMFNEEQK